MPVFIAALLGGLVQAAGSLVGRVLLSLGMGYVMYSGIDVSITFARDFLVTKLSAQHSQTLAVAGALQVGRCISILTSALIMRMTLNGLTGGAIKRLVVR
jgi:hypothetical protein